MSRKAIFIAIALGVAVLAGCPGKTPKPTPPKEEISPPEKAEPPTISEGFQATENLAKRAVLYKLAWQEGDLAPFTATWEEVRDMELPETPKKLVEGWWKIDWGTTRIAPIPLSEMTALEARAFPLMTATLVEKDEQRGWCMLKVSYDPDPIRQLIADAHTNWPPEEREMYLGGREENDCLQVWCVKIQATWKILAQHYCPTGSPD